MVRNQTIGNVQLVLIMVLFRTFELLTFVPHTGTTAVSSAFLAALPLGIGMLAVLMIPALLLLRKGEGGLVDHALCLSRPAGMALAGLLFLFLVLASADILSNFEFLLTSAVYPHTSSWFFVLTFAPVCAYAAYMGLEPLARIGSVVFIGTLSAVAFLLLAVLPKANFVYLLNPMRQGMMPVLRLALQICLSNFDVVAWLLLLPQAQGKGAKSMLGWMGCVLVISEVMDILLTVGLGDYAGSSMFPFYSLAAVSELSIFQRLDSLHITLWTFIGFVKVSVYLYLAAKCLEYFLPQRRHGLAVSVSAAAAAGCALLLSTDVRMITLSQNLLQAGIPVLLLATVIPLVLLVWGRVHKGREEAK